MIKNILFVSDTHGKHELINIPDNIDCIIHCGDESNSIEPIKNLQESLNFFDWFKSLDIRHKIFVPGNHSIAIEKRLIKPDDFPEINFLIHEQMELFGLKIFGSPYTPRFGKWSYMIRREVINRYWEQIPENIDILITHGPPKGILDLTINPDGKYFQCGCNALKKRVEKINPMIHCFGHIHDEPNIKNFGIYCKNPDQTKYANCSCVINNQKGINEGLVLNIQPTKVPN